MSDFDRYRRCSPLETLQLSSFDRCIPLGGMSYSMRTDMRANPLRQPNRSLPTSDTQDTPSRRQRISVACARCRKRKIRCSGDPGDGSGCQNCRTAGADISHCQFNRVGSGPIQGLSVLTYPSGLSSNQTLPMAPLYHGYPDEQGYSKYHSARSYSTAQGTVGYGDESPTESYGYQTTAAMPHSDTYGGQLTHDVLRNWAGTMRQNLGNNNGSHYLESEGPPVSYSGLPMPQLNSTSTTRQPVTTSENMSVFNLNSLQASLGSPPTHQASLPQSLENRHLPMPNTARMPLSPGQTYGGMRSRQPSAVSCGVLPTYGKTAMGWSQDPRGQQPSNGMMYNRRDSKNQHQHQHQLLPDGMHHQHHPHGGPGETGPSSYGYVPVVSNPDPTGAGTGYAPSHDLGDSDVKFAPPVHPHIHHAGNYKAHVNVGVGLSNGGIQRSDSTTSLSYYPSSSGSAYRRQGVYGSNERNLEAPARLVSGNQYQPLETPVSPVGENDGVVKKEVPEGASGDVEGEGEARSAAAAQVQASVRNRDSAGSLK
ncbi:hypothetical protein IWX90DRAFT_139273 [Phyllosticta citrichinensis]|uniref:Zn(2)-C6 fungal-type domain-containing protein n=1 Tax=Phyllosticta citrichinensis TaxID=1130410 RepID=A0ABR1XYW4_9PEZI